MGWFRRRVRLPADDIARDLFTIMVEEEEARDNPAGFKIPPYLVPSYKAKMWLYREAIVLMVLLSQEQKDPRYEDVLRAYERRVIGPASTPEGLAKLAVLKTAMKDLSALLDPEDEKPLTWSRTWMTALGHDETNPATLGLFSMWWMDRAIAVANALKELRPT
jgi:hypothetical protein